MNTTTITDLPSTHIQISLHLNPYAPTLPGYPCDSIMHSDKEFEPVPPSRALCYIHTYHIHEARISLTRLRISCHNLYIERGRYEVPLVPRENRWCVYCFYHHGVKPIEDENHVLISCPLYSSIREKFQFHPNGTSDLAGLLSNKNLDPKKYTSIGRAIHAILLTNEKLTSYYNSPDFHSSPTPCTIL